MQEEFFRGERGITSPTKATSSAHKGSGYLGYETPTVILLMFQNYDPK
jgi:hypothetical protein